MRSEAEQRPGGTGTARSAILWLVALLLTAAMVTAVGGCAGSGDTTTTAAPNLTTTTTQPATTSTEAETTTTAPVPMGWGTTGRWQGIAITAAEPQTDPSPESVDPGNKVVYSMVTLANDGKDPYDYNGLAFTLFDTNHQPYDSFGLTSLPDLGEGTLAPGGSIRGAVAFEVPAEAVPGGLAWQPRAASAPQLVWGEL